MSLRNTFAILLLSVLCRSARWDAAHAGHTETVLMDAMGENLGRAVSRDGLHAAWVRRIPDRGTVVVWDGKAGPAFEAVGARSLLISDDGKHLSYVAFEGGRMVVVQDGKAHPPLAGLDLDSITRSADGTRIAYAARTGPTRWAVVVNGVAHGEFDGIAADSIRFNGDHWACAAIDGGRTFVVTDGQRGPDTLGLVRGGMVLSRDGARIAYAARVPGGQAVHVDHVAGPVFDAIADGSLVASGDGRRLAYVGRRGTASVAVIDGKEGPALDRVAIPPTPAPSGGRFAWGGIKVGRFLMFLDAAAVGEYDGVAPGSVVFSADGQRLAFVAVADRKQWVVLDGRDEARADGIAAGSLRFSRDGRRFAYVAKVGHRYAAVLDGERGPEFDSVGVGDGSPAFSPDGKRFAYTARDDGDGGNLVVVDGRRCAAPAGLVTEVIRFSPDGKHVAWVAEAGQGQCVVLNERPGPTFDGIIPGGPRFEGDDAVAYLARKDRAIVRVVQTVKD